MDRTLSRIAGMRLVGEQWGGCQLTSLSCVRLYQRQKSGKLV